MTPSATDIAARRRAFRQMHQSGCFAIPNPWDVGIARDLQGSGFKALASDEPGWLYTMTRHRFGPGHAKRHWLAKRCVPRWPTTPLPKARACRPRPGASCRGIHHFRLRHEAQPA